MLGSEILGYTTFHTWVVIAIIALAIIFYSSEKYSIDITSLTIISTLLIFFTIFPYRNNEGNIFNPNIILNSFANPALITIFSLLIIGQAMIQSNILTTVPSYIVRATGNNFKLSMFILLIIILISSAFLNNTPVVIIFIPILYELTKHMKISPSKVMMPLSFMAISGGMLSLLGSSTNLLVAGLVVDLGQPRIGIFDFIVPGSILCSVSFIYIYFILPKLLPERYKHLNTETKDNQFIAQIKIFKNSEYVNVEIKEGLLPNEKDVMIRTIKRNNKYFISPFQDNFIIKENDTITISTTKEKISHLISHKAELFLRDSNSEVETDKEYIISSLEGNNTAEIIISPNSHFIGSTIKNAGFLAHHKCPVIAIQRKGSTIQSKMTQLRLVAGDTLLVIGKTLDLIGLRNSNNVILTELKNQEIVSFNKAIKIISIFLGVILSASFNILPIAIASFIGVVLLILMKCINMQQAARSIDYKIFLLIVASITLGKALQVTGGAALIAHLFLNLMSSYSNIVIIGTLFLAITLFTNLLSNNATAVLFTPISINLALKLGMDPKIFIYATIFASNCSFITPIGYQTNLLVFSPGKYLFKDFIKAGLPLSLLICFTYLCYLKVIL